tara:strand:+ start:261 stop:584 length:324 start_codon:yes stop_codon:yes gene_type:complete
MKEVLISNIKGEDEHGNPVFIDRIYGTGPTQRLIQKDATVYQGTITKRRITVKRLTREGSFNSHVWETADGRWFDRGGMPIEKPEQLINDKEEESTETSSIDGNTET